MPQPPFPQPGPDNRPCSANRWGAGIDILPSNNRVQPIGIVRDGLDGCFVLTREVDLSTFGMTFRLHHVDSAGVTTSSVVLTTGLAVSYAVESATGSCIVVWSSPSWGGRLEAQRFDVNCAALWANVVTLSQAALGFDDVAATADGRSGAVIAFRDNASGTFTSQTFRVQRVDVKGNLLWGASGSVVVGAGPKIPSTGMQPQLVGGSGWFAVIWHADFHGVTGPLDVTAAWFDDKGRVSKLFSVGKTFEIWNSSTKRVAVPDGSGGFYVSLVQVSSQQLLRFDRRKTSPARTMNVTPPILPQAYALAEDGTGGALLASVSGAGLVSVARFDSTGVNVWAQASAMQAAMITFGLPLGVPVPSEWGGVVAVAAKPNTGAILVYPDWTPDARLQSQCFDDSGEPIGQGKPLSWVLGPQECPVLTDRLDGAVTTATPGSAFLPGTVVCAWRGSSGATGTSVTLQKLGCCANVQVNIPVIPGSVPPNWPAAYRETLFVSFPSSQRSERYGVVPLSALAAIPNVSVPGSVLTPGVDAPGWIRIQLENVPDDVSVDLWTHRAKLKAAAERTPDGIARLTFKPSTSESYLMRFRRARHSTGLPRLPLTVHVSFGAGDAPPLPTARVAKPASTARRRPKPKRAPRARTRSSRGPRRSR